MAGEWLKFDASTPEKPEVFAITLEMGWDDPDLTVGKLLKVWRWFDQHTIEGNAANVTLALLDRVVGVTGFAKAMCNVGWLVQVDAGLTLPHFDRHNGKTAKDRALTAKRVATHKSNAKGNDEGNADSVTNALPREEKRRINKDIAPKASKFSPLEFLVSHGADQQIASDYLQVRKTKKLASTQTAFDDLMAEVEKSGQSLNDILKTCCKKGWGGFMAKWLQGEAGETPAWER